MTEPSEFTVSRNDLGIASELRDKEFRDQFFRTERELDIPAQLRALRKLRGLNQDELAEMIGTKQSGISRLERSSHGKWNLETLVKIAEALDARLAVLIEPYEAVVPRYRAAAIEQGQSAATAQTESAPPLRNVPEEPDQDFKQKTPDQNSAGKVSEQAWNW